LVSSPPTAPANLSAIPISASQITLTWTDQSTSEADFQIERKTGAGGTYAQIGTVGANVTTYSDSGLAEGTTYFYRVRAFNAAGNSAYSNEAISIISPFWSFRCRFHLHKST
jgi:predicted phage tail protein